jgi:hypothetical protein
LKKDFDEKVAFYFVWVWDNIQIAVRSIVGVDG